MLTDTKDTKSECKNSNKTILDLVTERALVHHDLGLIETITAGEQGVEGVEDSTLDELN